MPTLKLVNSLPFDTRGHGLEHLHYSRSPMVRSHWRFRAFRFFKEFTVASCGMSTLIERKGKGRRKEQTSSQYPGYCQ